MIIFLSIITTIFVIFAFVSFVVCLDTDSILPSRYCDTLLEFICHCYMTVLISVFCLSVVFCFCYGVTGSIYCSIKNYDTKECKIFKNKEND